MRLIFVVVMMAAVAGTASCKKQPEGAIKVLVIGDPPRIADPSQGPLSQSEELLAGNVAQGLVRFDASADIVSGLAERWTVTDDGLSFIFRIASASWPDGSKISAQQVARLLKHEIAPHSKNSLKDQFGAIDDIVAMTDRVIEIHLKSPRPDFLELLAQPEMAILRTGEGTGPFVGKLVKNGAIKLERQTPSSDEESANREEILLENTTSRVALASFEAANCDLVLGGTFLDIPRAEESQLPRNSLRFDPASGLFGLVPLRRPNGRLDKPEIRRLLSQAIERGNFVAALGVAGLVPRTTLLEPGLDGVANPKQPQWSSTPLANRIGALEAQANRLFGKEPKPSIAIAMPPGEGAEILLHLLQRDWGALGFTVEKAKDNPSADFLLVDKIAPSTSPAWFVRQFRCGMVAICDPKADQLMDEAREASELLQRYELLQQAADQIDQDQLFLPIAAPVRWSLVSARIQNFVPNRFARHSLTDLEARPSSEE